MPDVSDILDGFGEWFDVEPNTGCWLWFRNCNASGYGNVRFNGRRDRAHRVMYRLCVGEVPENRLVLHKCDTPSCVNPAHLYVGTHWDNMRDRRIRNRQATGETHGAAKLTNTDVFVIKYLRDRPIEAALVAEAFDVHPKTIRNIWGGITWKQVSADSLRVLHEAMREVSDAG